VGCLNFRALKSPFSKNMILISKAGAKHHKQLRVKIIKKLRMKKMVN